MNQKLPHTIQNCVGEELTFQSIVSAGDEKRILVHASCKPGAGPAMHVHFRQDESLTVRKGKMGYQILGEAPKVCEVGETILFPRGTPHKFWAADGIDLEMEGWIQPVENIVFYLSAIYAAQNASGKAQPEAFDGAYLATRYKSEYDVPEIPAFVKRVIFPITIFIGKLLGKYKKFKDAPEPLV